MKIVKWILDLFKPSYKVRCIDCGRIIDVNKESHYWWNEKSPGRTDDERTFVQCVDCAIDEDN